MPPVSNQNISITLGSQKDLFAFGCPTLKVIFLHCWVILFPNKMRIAPIVISELWFVLFRSHQNFCQGFFFCKWNFKWWVGSKVLLLLSLVLNLVCNEVRNIPCYEVKEANILSSHHTQKWPLKRPSFRWWIRVKESINYEHKIISAMKRPRRPCTYVVQLFLSSARIILGHNINLWDVKKKMVAFWNIHFRKPRFLWAEVL